MHGFKNGLHKGSGIQRGQLARKRQLKHKGNAQCFEQGKPVFTRGQGHVPALGKQHLTGVRPEGHDHRGQAFLRSNLKGAADKSLMPKMDAVKITDGDG